MTKEQRGKSKDERGKRFSRKTALPQNDEKLNFEFVTDERSKRRGQIYLHYALQEGGNEDLLLVILNFELQNVSLCGFWNLLTH